jgi:hypothetical protein
MALVFRRLFSMAFLFAILSQSACAPLTVPSPAITLTPSSVSTPASSPYDGRWAGTTDQEKPVSFTVLGNAISFVKVEFVLPGCSLTQSIIRPNYFSGNTFNVNQPDFQPMMIRGTFDSPTSVAGIITIGKQECGGPIMLRYAATKQPAGT